jgi:hypothetical protein
MSESSSADGESGEGENETSRDRLLDIAALMKAVWLDDVHRCSCLVVTASYLQLGRTLGTKNELSWWS